MEKIPCSVGILTFNSGATLRRALESVKDIEDIVVCDGGSTDETLAIAQEYGAHIINQEAAFKDENNRLIDYAGVHNQCIDARKQDWFLYLDSDEEATPELIADIRSVTTSTNPEYMIFAISPRINFEGRLIEYSSNYPGWQKRFFNCKTGARFIQDKLHTRIAYDENRYPTGYLNGHWIYFTTANDSKGGKIDRYARLDALGSKIPNFFELLRLTAIKGRTIAGTLGKSVLIMLRRRRAKRLPFKMEMTRVTYQLLIVKYLWKRYFTGGS